MLTAQLMAVGFKQVLVIHNIILSDFQKLNIRRPYKHLRSSLPGETGLGLHTPSTCAGMCIYH